MVIRYNERSDKAGELDFTWVVRTLFVVCSLPPPNPDLVGWAIGALVIPEDWLGGFILPSLKIYLGGSVYV